MVVVSVLSPHAKFERNDRRESWPTIIKLNSEKIKSRDSRIKRYRFRMILTITISNQPTMFSKQQRQGFADHLPDLPSTDRPLVFWSSGIPVVRVMTRNQLLEIWKCSWICLLAHKINPFLLKYCFIEYKNNYFCTMFIGFAVKIVSPLEALERTFFNISLITDSSVFKSSSCSSIWLGVESEPSLELTGVGGHWSSIAIIEAMRRFLEPVWCELDFGGQLAPSSWAK